MEPKNSYIDIMRRRQSIRTFDSVKLSKSNLSQLTSYINKEKNQIGPFGGKGLVTLVQVTNNHTEKGIKLGTYGFIKNPQAYLVGSAKNEKYALVEYAFLFHKVLLFATQLGLGTCWMGGTFSRNSFEKEIQLQENEFIPMSV
ncbi:nitroreductase family protein [Halalkalibacter krulwichiae]|uniref:Nitroreductase family protein n=1 Tax=Halalkalibacter krulwichiae TaxID=199441 RepID=A0A1X9ME49_9BACI|nr:nitroreductase family protein [Halalkalibacter krulwichiae]ARK29811.1 Nitroreductase family protein [Halalkalibacter krulwichiae]